MLAIVRWSLRYRILVVGIAAAVMVIGVAQLRSAPVDVLPEYSPPYVEVQTEAIGLSAAEVEQFVTVPLEALMLSGVAWVETIRSESVPGLSSIVLIFEPGTDVMRARQVVQERLTQAHILPKVAKPPQMIQPLSSASRVMIVSLASTSMSLTDLSVHARWTVRPRLMGVPGVANVAIWGHRERQLQVLVDPQRLRQPWGEPRPGHPDDGQLALGVAAELSPGVHAGRRRVHRHAQPAPRDPPRPPHPYAGGPRPRSDRWAAEPSSRRRRLGRRGSPAHDRRRPDR